MARIILSCVHYPVAAGRFLYWVLHRMGHEVITVGPAPGAYLPWAAPNRSLEEYEWKPDVALYFENYGQRMVVESEDALAKLSYPPDLIIQMDARFIMQGKAPCPNVLWAIDNHVEPYGAYEDFDKIFIAHSFGHMRDLPNAEWLPCAYDPRHHFVIDEHAPRELEVAMVGAGYPERAALVETLAKAGIQIHATTGLLYGEYNMVYNHAKIALVKSARGDLPMRIFENMGQGCLVVTDRQQDLEKCGFKENYHYLGYESVDECVERIKGALVMYDAVGIQSMIGLSREAVKPHTWENRVKHILGSVGLV